MNYHSSVSMLGESNFLSLKPWLKLEFENMVMSMPNEHPEMHQNKLEILID